MKAIELDIKDVVRKGLAAVKRKKMGYHLEGTNVCEYRYEKRGFRCVIGHALTLGQIERIGRRGISDQIATGEIKPIGAPARVFTTLQLKHDSATRFFGGGYEFESYLNKLAKRYGV